MLYLYGALILIAIWCLIIVVLFCIGKVNKENVILLPNETLFDVLKELGKLIAELFIIFYVIFACILSFLYMVKYILQW